SFTAGSCRDLLSWRRGSRIWITFLFTRR
ncbi:MAG TPA: hypothetical protein EYO90_07295, partial [Candidatus Latescibacteria bacterium]|nr:hypothetical protein [Candidatus Latescibacterota bacterium]